MRKSLDRIRKIKFLSLLFFIWVCFSSALLIFLSCLFLPLSACVWLVYQCDQCSHLSSRASFGIWEGFLFSFCRAVRFASPFQYIFTNTSKISTIFHRQVLWTFYPVTTLIPWANDNWHFKDIKKKSYILTRLSHLNDFFWFILGIALEIMKATVKIYIVLVFNFKKLLQFL